MKKALVTIFCLFSCIIFLKFDYFSVFAAYCGDEPPGSGCHINCYLSSSGPYDPCSDSGRTCTNSCDVGGCTIPEDCPNKSNQEQCGNQACSVGKQCNSGQCQYFCVGSAPCNPTSPPGATAAPTTPPTIGPTNTPIPPSPPPPGATIPPPTPRDPPAPECSAWGGGDVRLRVTNGSLGNQFRFFTYSDNVCAGTELSNSGWIPNKSFNVAGLGSGGYSWDARARYTAALGGSSRSACSSFRVDRAPPDNPAVPSASAVCSPARANFSWPAVSDNRCLGTVSYWVQGWDSNNVWFINAWVPDDYTVGQVYSANGYSIRVNSATSISVTNPNTALTYYVRIRAGDTEAGTHPNQTAWTAAGSTNFSTCPVDPIGTFDSLSCTVAAGWACDNNNNNTSLTVRLYEGATLLATTIANVNRPDVAASGLCGGTGNHGFSITTPSSIIDGNLHTITAKALDINSAGATTGTEVNLPWGNFKTIQCTLPAWYKLRDASFNKIGGLNDPIPKTATINPFDGTTDDNGSRYLITTSGTNDPGIIFGNPITIPDPSTDQSLFSSKQWFNSSYAPYTSFDVSRFVAYVKSRKEYVNRGSSLPAAIDTNKITLITSSVNIFSGNINVVPNAAPAVLIVEGNITISDNFNLGASPRSVVLIATGDITFASGVTEANGVFIAGGRIDFGGGVNPLKIKGNISSKQAATNLRARADSTRPSEFIVMYPQMYLDTLSLLSTSTYEWKQLQ